MAADPHVAIVIVNWNGRQITLDCLASLEAMTYRNVRTIIVDNASTDGSAEAIAEKFPHVTQLRMPRNLKFAGGTNEGLRFGLQQGADLLLLLNNDTTVDKNFLSAMVGRMYSRPDIGMVAPKIYYHSDPDKLWFAGGTLSMWTGTMRHIGIREIDRGQYDTPREIPYCTGCCILVRRSVAETVGILDESYAMYTEDADWSLRVRKAGYAIVFEPRAKVWHKISVSAGGHLSLFKMRNKFLSNFRFFARHASWYHWLFFPWLSIMVNAFAAVRYLLTATSR